MAFEVPPLFLVKATTIERVARLIWMMESGHEADWDRHLDEYRKRARAAVMEPEGYVLAAEPIHLPDPPE